MSSPSTSIRVMRVISWIVACLPLLYFIVWCTMAADYRSQLGPTADVANGLPLSAWGLMVRRLSAHLGEATFALPTLWALLVLFAELPKGRLVTQAVLVAGGCIILVFCWGFAAQMLGNGSLVQ